MSDSYTFEKKKRLVDRIKKLTSKTDWMNVKKIITENNPELDCMKNSNGYFMQFKNLSDKTYIELTKYLDKSEKKKLKELESEVMDTSIVTSDEKSNSNSDDKSKNKKTVSKKLRLTNTESHILNRIKYENELKKNEEEATLSDNNDTEERSHKSTNKKTDDIFVQTGKKKATAKSKK